MRLFTCLFLCLFTLTLSAQEIENVTLLDQWEDPELPDAGSLSYNDVWGWTDCNGNEYGIFGSSAFIHFFDVSDPSNIIEVNSFAGGSTTIWRDMKTYADHAYAVCDNCSEGIMIFDLSGLPGEVTMVQQTTEWFNSSHNIFVDEEAGRLYAVGTNTNGSGVFIFDLTEDPGNPVLIAQPTLEGGYVHDINVFDNIAYASSGNNGLYVYDFSDPDAPVTLGTLTSYPEQGYNHSSWPNADFTTLIMADETHDRGLKTLDISDLDDIAVQDVFRSEFLAPEVTGSIAHNPFIRDNYAFVSYYHDGLQVFDLSDPENVVKVAAYDTETNHDNYSGFTGMWGVYPFLPSGTILASDTHHGFFTFSLDAITLTDIETPAFPEINFTAQSGTTVCEGQSVNLFVNPGAEIYEFYNDGELIAESDANTFAAMTAGEYTAAARNGFCRTEAAETVTVTVTQYPDAGVEISTDGLLCGAGDVEQLSAPEGADGYIWYLDGTQLTSQSEAVIQVDQPGTYTLTAINNGCTADSQPVTVTALADDEIPVITPDDVEECTGDIVTLETTVEFDNYQWTFNGEDIDGATTGIIEVNETGTYGVYTTLTETCTPEAAPVTAVFYIPEIPTVSVTENILIASNGASWQWFLNDEEIEGANEQSYTATETGNYRVSVMDENGCFALSADVFITVSNVYEVASGTVQILPNPASEVVELRLQTTASRASYRIFDVTGRNLATAQNIPANGSIRVEVADWASGMYFLEIVLDEEAVLTDKIFKN